jgi:hypothetical protein
MSGSPSWESQPFTGVDLPHVPRERLIGHILSGVVLRPTDYGHIEHCVRCARIMADTLTKKLESQGRGAVSIEY